ncbi:hypothetical protein ENBRE01_2700, partial [Enteropsectra breve]
MNFLALAAYRHLQNGHYHSALLIVQYLHNMHSDSPETYYVVVKALFELGFNDKIKQIIEERPGLLEYKQITLVYLKTGEKSDANASKNLNIPIFPDFEHESLAEYARGLHLREENKRKCLLKAYMLDPTFLEPLVYLYKDSLCGLPEICRYIEELFKSNAKIIEASGITETVLNTTFHELKNAYIQILNFLPSKDILSPVSLHAVTAKYVKNADFEGLFKHGAASNMLFRKSEFAKEALGLYYLHCGKLNQARNIFFECFSLNKKRGRVYLYAGIAMSRLREYEEAVKYFTKAHFMMGSSYLPSYYLAHEYQKIFDFHKAKFYFKICVSILENSGRLKPEACSEEENVFFENEAKSCNIQKTKKDKKCKGSPHDSAVSLMRDKNSTKGFSYIDIKKDCDTEFHRMYTSIFEKTYSAEDVNKTVPSQENIQNQESEYFSKKYKCSSPTNTAAQGILYNYIHLLINAEDYDEAMEILVRYNIENLLLVYCLLFQGKHIEAQSALEKCPKDAYFFATEGFL